MSQRGNVNEKSSFKSAMAMNNGNDNARYEREREIDLMADMLAEKFNNPTYRSFYCKVARRLSPARIHLNIERAFAAKKGNPSKLFTYLCKVDGV